MIKKMPVMMLCFMIFIMLFHRFIPIQIQSCLYAMSLSIKVCILFVLPFVIFGLLFNTTVQLANKATKTILLILTMVCVSNFASTLLSGSIGSLVNQFNFSMMTPENLVELNPAWTFNLPKLIANDKAILLAIILGLTLNYLRPAAAKKIGHHVGRYVNLFLAYFTYIVPLFIIGFIVKLAHDGAISMIVHDYALVFSVIFLCVFFYILILYFLTSHFSFSTLALRVKNMLPAAFAGFSTMSSAAAMPFTILGTEANASNKSLARSVIPATVNIHLIGDCFAIPILAFAILKSFDMPAPTLYAYLIFAFYFVIAKFSVAAIPGGGIIVMLPILESTMGFNAPMLSLITALYILFDPVVTSANVLGNGAFALIIDKLKGHTKEVALP